MPTYTNTKTTLGSEDAAFNALVAHELTEFNDDSILELGQYAFYKQTTLQSIYLPALTKINSNAFDGCENLKRIFVGLNKNTVCTLSSTTALSNTGRSIIYVPDDLVSNYRSASNWSTYAGRIYGISELGQNEWDETEITDDAETIAAKVNAGTAASSYHIGQYKTISLKNTETGVDEGTIRMQIVGKNMRGIKNSEDTAQLEWLAMDLLKTNHRMNPAFDNNTEGTGAIGGMAHNEMQTYLDTTIWALIPEVWQNIIKETEVVTAIYNTSGSSVKNDVTYQKLRVPSYREVFGGTSYESQGPVYSMAFPDSNTRKRAKVGSTSAATWWLRSAYTTNTFMYVNSSGSNNYATANTSYGVALSFST